MTDTPANYKQVLTAFSRQPNLIQGYFGSLPELVRKYDWPISISYIFSQIEVMKHRTLYCGLIKLHWTDTELTSDLLDLDHMSRGRFRELFAIIFGKRIDKLILDRLSAAEAVRDKVAHGKRLTQAEARKCIADALDFASSFDQFVFELGGFRPFGDLRGFKGRKEALSKNTTRWVLRGMGIPATKVPQLIDGPD